MKDYTAGIEVLQEDLKTEERLLIVFDKQMENVKEGLLINAYKGSRERRVKKIKQLTDSIELLKNS